MSDAIHDFGDCFAVGVAFVLEKKSDNKPNYVYTYGYKSYSVISAILTSFVLLVGSVVVIYSAVCDVNEFEICEDEHHH